MDRYQLWISKGGNWAMAGFFDSVKDATDRYRSLRDGATTEYKVVRVNVPFAMGPKNMET